VRKGTVLARRTVQLLRFGRSRSDIGQAVKTLESRGVAFDDQPHVVHRDPAYDLWMAFLRDPDGNVVALMSEVPKE